MTRHSSTSAAIGTDLRVSCVLCNHPSENYTAVLPLAA